MIIFTFIRFIYKIITRICQAIADVLIYFGLVVPLIYVIYATLVCVIYNVDLRIFNLHSLLYFSGLALSFICSIVITFRKFHSHQKGEIEPYVESRPPKKHSRNDASRYMGDNEDNYDDYNQSDRRPPRPQPQNLPYNYYEVGGKGGETPLVYQHSRYPGIICFEYSSRIEYFGINGNQLIYLRSTNKDN